MFFLVFCFFLRFWCYCAIISLGYIYSIYIHTDVFVMVESVNGDDRIVIEGTRKLYYIVYFRTFEFWVSILRMRVQRSTPFLEMSIVHYVRLIEDMFGMILFVVGSDYPLYGWWNCIGIPASTCQYEQMKPKDEMNITQMYCKVIKFEKHHARWCMMKDLRFL